MIKSAAASSGINGITRNRTQQFIKYRESCRSLKRTGSSAPVVKTDNELYPSIELKTLDSSQLLGEPSEHIVNIPPEWVARAEDITMELNAIKQKIADLKKLHKSHLMVQLGEENVNDQHAIEALTGEITRMLSQVHGKVKNLGKGQLHHTSDQIKLVKNAQTALATQVGDITQHFREAQQKYLTKLRTRSSKLQDNFQENIVDYEDKGFTDEQMAAMQFSQGDAVQRYKEIRSIAKSVIELSEIVRDLHSLVIDQGTILDRIDYNIEKTYDAITEGEKELDKASKIQSKTRTKMCLLLLIILIICAGIILVIRLAL